MAEGPMAKGKLPRFSIGLAGFVLLGTAALHASGYRSVAEAIAGSEVSSFIKRAAPSLWLFFSWHLSALAAGCFWAAVQGGAAARVLVWFVAVVVIVDLLWVLSIAGLFAGTGLLALAAVCTIVAGVRWQTA